VPNVIGDYATALEIWISLAEQGNAGAQSELANRAQADAQNKLGVMYYTAHGVQRDYAEAVKWWRLAAEQGHAKAQFNLGSKYRIGRGVPQDDVLAHMWFNIAAALGDEAAEYGRDFEAMLMTPDQIVEAQRMAREWMAKHQQ
jgi:TPR repeat protein